MTPRQIELVQNSFAAVLSMQDAAAHIFYRRLFELDPSLRPLFIADVKRHGRKLMESIKAVVWNLRKLDRIIPGVQAMAVRHAPYAVQARYYSAVGNALVDTLAIYLSDGFTDEMREAWLTACTLLAISMKAAADEQYGGIAA